jgi:uncharacterized protein (TIGR02001 family)
MKKSSMASAIGAAVLVGGLTAPSVALAEFSANIGATSNYVWRGASQTGNSPAIQGGIDYEHGSGFYAGTWVSNVDFGSSAEIELGEDGFPVDGLVSVRNNSEYEADFYLGWGMDLTDDLSIDLGYTYYYYGQIESGADFGEIYGSVGFMWFEVGAYYTVNDQADGDDADINPFVAGDFFYYGKFSIDLAENWSLSLTAGSYMFENDGAFDDTDYDYAYAQADITRSGGDFGDVTLSVSDADSDSADGNGNAKVFISWTKGF